MSAGDTGGAGDAGGITIRELSGYAQMRALSELLTQIWGFQDQQIIPKETFTGASISGHQVHGAFDGSSLVGGSWGFPTWDGTTLGLHSHITGVLPAHQGTGAGLALKQAQRRWCLDRGIATITWTFDPMVARNAAFNLRKLGAKGVAFLPDHYGSMSDRFNQGQPTDRMEVVWDLSVAAGAQPPPGSGITTVPLEGASRGVVSAALSSLFGQGYVATWFDTRGYLLERPSSSS